MYKWKFVYELFIGFKSFLKLAKKMWKVLDEIFLESKDIYLNYLNTYVFVLHLIDFYMG